MPSPVDKYFKQIKKDNPSYSDEQAWATAWSVFCKYKNPGSPSCHKPTEEYLKREASAAPLLEFYNTLLAHSAAEKPDPDDVKRRLSAYTNVVVKSAIVLDSHTRKPLEFYAKCSEILSALGDVFDHVDDEELAAVLREASKEILSSGETYHNKNYWKKLPKE